MGTFIHLGVPTMIGGNYIVRREALESVGGHNTNLKFYGDDTDIAR